MQTSNRAVFSLPKQLYYHVGFTSLSLPLDSQQTYPSASQTLKSYGEQEPLGCPLSLVPLPGLEQCMLTLSSLGTFQLLLLCTEALRPEYQVPLSLFPGMVCNANRWIGSRRYHNHGNQMKTSCLPSSGKCSPVLHQNQVPQPACQRSLKEQAERQQSHCIAAPTLPHSPGFVTNNSCHLYFLLLFFFLLVERKGEGMNQRGFSF